MKVNMKLSTIDWKKVGIVTLSTAALSWVMAEGIRFLLAPTATYYYKVVTGELKDESLTISKIMTFATIVNLRILSSILLAFIFTTIITLVKRGKIWPEVIISFMIILVAYYCDWPK